MGQKTHPTGFRIGVNKKHNSTWFADYAAYSKVLEEDYKIRKFFEKELCYQALVMLAIQMLYYLMYPWPEKMADHLETKEQKDLWKNVNSHMSKRYSAALFIGVLSVWL